MSTVAQIQRALSELSTDDLKQVELALHEQYRRRNQHLVYDNSYGATTDADLIAEADVAFLAYDEEENTKANAVKFGW